MMDKYCSNLDVECRFRNNDNGRCIKDGICAFKEEIILNAGQQLLARYLLCVKKQQDEILRHLGEKQI